MNGHNDTIPRACVWTLLSLVMKIILKQCMTSSKCNLGKKIDKCLFQIRNRNFHWDEFVQKSVKFLDWNQKHAHRADEIANRCFYSLKHELRPVWLRERGEHAHVGKCTMTHT